MKEEGIADRLMKRVKDRRRQRRLERIAELEKQAKDEYLAMNDWRFILEMLSDDEYVELMRLYEQAGEKYMAKIMIDELARRARREEE